MFFACPASTVEEQQADPHDHPEPARTRHRGGRGVHRVHPPDAVHRRPGPAPHHAVRGDPRLAPPRWQVAQRPLPLLWSSCSTSPVRTKYGYGLSGKECITHTPEAAVCGNSAFKAV